MNTDQASQFTSFAWTGRLKRNGIRVSMDGKGRLCNNILVDRLWRSLKYECVYLHAWETGSQARAGVRREGRGTMLGRLALLAAARATSSANWGRESLCSRHRDE